MAPPHLRPILGRRLSVPIPPFLRRLHQRSLPTAFIRHNTQDPAVAPPHLPPPYTFCGPSNGLLLLLDLQISHRDAFSVFNPVTGASAQIPDYRIPDGTSSHYGFTCNLSPNESPPTKSAFSVLNPSNRLRMGTFSSDTREWTTSYIDTPQHAEFCNYGPRAMVASDGIIYLIDDHLTQEDGGWWNDINFTVVSCDPTEGRPSWSSILRGMSMLMTATLGSFSVCRRGARTPHCKVWVLSRDKTWTLKHRFSFGLENNGDIEIFYFCKEDRAIYVNLKSRLVQCFYEDEQWRFEDVCACRDPCEPGIHIKPFTFSPWPISLPALTL